MLVERNVGEQLFFSGDGDQHQTTRALSMAVLSPKGQFVIRLDSIFHQGGNSESSIPEKENYVVPATFTECTPVPKPLENTCRNAGDDADIHGFSM